MVKTIKKIKFGEEPEVETWAQEYSGEERLRIAAELTDTLWRFAHNEPFPRLDRSVVKFIRVSEREDGSATVTRENAAPRCSGSVATR